MIKNKSGKINILPVLAFSSVSTAVGLYIARGTFGLVEIISTGITLLFAFIVLFIANKNIERKLKTNNK